MVVHLVVHLVVHTEIHMVVYTVAHMVVHTVLHMVLVHMVVHMVANMVVHIVVHTLGHIIVHTVVCSSVHTAVRSDSSMMNFSAGNDYCLVDFVYFFRDCNTIAGILRLWMKFPTTMHIDEARTHVVCTMIDDVMLALLCRQNRLVR